MKRALKIMIPLILVLALLVGAGWYFGFYNRPLTVDMLLSFSASMERSRFTSMSVRAYNWAYDLSGHDPAIAIDLANSYWKQGNFTKAEYTLVTAITQNPSVELYLTLSKVYVAQDKLLDAATMLDKISDPDIKAELDSMRPAAPTAQPEQGFYNNYVDVSLACDSGTLYYTTDGEYPSVEGEVYAAPLSLGAGETNISAIAVGENGLVSSRAVFGYTVDGVIENVSLMDSSLDAYVRGLLSKNEDSPLRSDELWSITEMELPEEVQDFSDLSHFTGLTALTIHNQSNLSFDFLAGMTAMTKLDLSGCRLDRQALEIVASLPKLSTLTLNDCSLSNIEPLANATGLTVLGLSDNSINNIAPLAGLTALTNLDLHRNALTSLASLSGMTELKTLDLSYNSIEDISPLSSCVILESLDISENKVTAIAAVNRMTALKTLNAAHNAITDVAPVTGCTALTELHLDNNALEDISALGAVSGLTILDVSHNQIAALPSFAEDSALHDFYATNNVLTDIAGLRGLKDLTIVDLDYNPELKDIAALNACGALAQVNVYGTQVSDVAALRERDVVVNFDPTV